MFTTRQRQLELKIYRQRHKRKKRFCHEPFVSEFKYLSRLKLTTPLLIKQFYRKGYIDNAFVTKSVLVPADFSFESNFDDCVIFFKRVLSLYTGKVKLQLTSRDVSIQALHALPF